MNEREIFANALQKVGAARIAYLNTVCGDEDAVRARIEVLLHEQSELGDFLETPAVVSPVEPRLVALCQREPPGTEVGPYTLLEEIGEGGMGVVYLAQQHEPVRRQVALKIIKPGMDTRDVVTRFEAERQALALMDHPCIAKVYDAGATDAGRPYFVMELVKGIPIAQYCDQQRLSPQERLELFIRVCQAVQHAHQKGIIHRDLKPSNILVAQYDGRPVPKVIDFGVAKAISEKLTETTMCTQPGQVVGTWAYMSPEQTDLKQLDIDTRSDIYSLGVLLYELLTGSTPVERKRVQSSTSEEVMRIIREEEPLRPSVRLRHDDSLASISSDRQMDSRKLPSFVRGDLDWIVMKALEKERARRYQTANSLASDVRSFLRDEPVKASPPSAADRLRKFARRNKAFLTTAVVVSAALVVGSVVSIWQAIEADQARRVANDQLAVAQAKEAYTRQLVYAADIRLAAQAWKDGDIRQFTDLLDAHRSAEEPQDLRGFEWNYLYDLGHAAYRTAAAGADGYCCVRHSPDGSCLVMGRDDGQLCVISLPAGEQVAARKGHDGLLRDIAFAPDGKTMATIGDDGMIRLWETARWNVIRCFQAHEGIGFHVAYALGGSVLVSSGEDPIVRLWDVLTGEPRGELKGHTEEVEALAVSPDGRLVASGAREGGKGLWDLQTRARICWLALPESNDYRARCCRFSPDGTLLAIGRSDNLIRLWDVQKKRRIKVYEGHDDDIQDIAFHPTGTMMASCDRAGVVRTWKLPVSADGSQEAEQPQVSDWWPAYFRGHASRCWSLRFSAEGHQLTTASKDGHVRAWTGRFPTRQLLPGTVEANDIAFSTQGELFIPTDAGFCVHQPGSEILRPLGERWAEDRECMTVSPDGVFLATGHEDGRVRMWRTDTGRLETTFVAHQDAVEPIRFSPDAATMMTTCWDGTVKLWDVGSTKQLAVFHMQPHCYDAGFSPDGKLIAVASQNSVMVYDVKSQQCVHRLQGHQNTVSRVVFSPDGRSLATSSHDRSIRIWDVHTGKTRHTIAAHRRKIFYLAFSPDGRTIASGDEGGTIAFSHVMTGRLMFHIDGPWGRIIRLAFSPDGRTLAVVSAWWHVMLIHARGPGESSGHGDSGSL
jgi:WD40 repeat protein/serine/threonine protein kinase